MTRTTKILIAIAIILILGGGIYYLDTSALSQGAQTAVAPASQNVAAENVSTSSGPATLPSSGSNNQALNQDLSAIDSQLSGLNSDNTNVSQSLNDQQVQQSSI